VGAGQAGEKVDKALWSWVNGNRLSLFYFNNIRTFLDFSRMKYKNNNSILIKKS
jgi:hypothetical protein